MQKNNSKKPCKRFMKKLPTSPPTSDFPSDVLKWMKKNAKPKVELKLMQICKYFLYQKFPYVHVKGLMNGRNQHPSLPMFEYNYRNVHLNKTAIKFWLTGKLAICSETNFNILFPKIAVCDITSLSLSDPCITFEQFNFLADSGNITTLDLNSAIVKDSNGRNIPLEDILERLPNLSQLTISGNANSFVSYQQKKIPSNLKKFTLCSIKENFNIEECFKFIQNNQQICFYLYSSYITPQRLQPLIDNLIKAWSPKNRPPMINLKRQSDESKQKLRNLEKSFSAYQKKCFNNVKSKPTTLKSFLFGR